MYIYTYMPPTALSDPVMGGHVLIVDARCPRVGIPVVSMCLGDDLMDTIIAHTLTMSTHESMSLPACCLFIIDYSIQSWHSSLRGWCRAWPERGVTFEATSLANQWELRRKKKSAKTRLTSIAASSGNEVVSC